MTKARDIADFKFENIVDTGTEGTKIALGTTGQRGSTTGQFRFNSTTGLAEYYTGTVFKPIDSPPTVSGVGASNITESQINSNYDLSITGSSFSSGATVKFVGANNTEYTSPSVTVNSDTSITARVPTTVTNANEPFSVKVTNSSGLAGTLASAFNVDAKPAWQTASGSIGDVGEGNAVNVSATATDAEGDTVSYAETGGTVLSTNNLTLNTSTGAITGTAPSVNNDTTISFNLRATSGSQTTDRAFSINFLNANGSSQARATADLSEISYDNTSGSAHKKWVIVNGVAKNVYVKNHNDGWYWVLTHTFGGTNGLTTNNNDVLIKAGTYYTTENMHNATTDKLRFSDTSNNYVTSAQGNSF